jgi:hypothetical protein
MISHHIQLFSSHTVDTVDEDGYNNNGLRPLHLIFRFNINISNGGKFLRLIFCLHVKAINHDVYNNDNTIDNKKFPNELNLLMNRFWCKIVCADERLGIDFPPRVLKSSCSQSNRRTIACRI